MQTALLAVGFVVLAAMSGTTLWLVRQTETNFRWTAHSQDVQSALLQLQLSIRRAESGERGYMLTSDTDYLDLLRTSLDVVPGYVDKLQTLVADNPEQAARAALIGELVSAKLAELKRIADLQIAGNPSEALDIIRDPEGQSLMTRFIDATRALRDAEIQLQEERKERSRSTASLLLAVSLFGAGLIVALAIITILLIRRFIAGLVAAQTALADANANLEAKVEERTTDLKEANEELQRFAYIVSHDLRSPLVNIMGFTGELDAIRRDLADEQPRDGTADPARQQILADFDEALGFITSSISKMDRLIKAILDLSRAGRRDFMPEMLDLDTMFGAMRDALSHQAQEVGAEIRIEPLPQIESDRLAVEQIFSNLLDNAVKYLKPGHIGRVVVSGEEKIGFAIIRVSDNGRGIAPEDRERVFELFRRAGAQDRPGEGIGLAHVRALVRRLGGSIRLESEPGEGSTFTVILPKRWRG